MFHLIWITCALAVPPLLLIAYDLTSAVMVLILYTSTAVAWIIAGYIEHNEYREEDDDERR